MPSRTWTLRMAAQMGAGAFGVHQVRFELSPARGAALHAHGYLAPLGAVLVGLLLFALAAGLARIARGVVEEVPRLRRLWGGTSLSLLAVYCLQESIEGMLTQGSPLAMFDRGGWVALPLAFAIGLAIALAMCGAAAASAAVAAPRRAQPLSISPAPLLAVLEPWLPRRSTAAARHLAARAPPLASV